jgi:hypothetical protein
MITLILLIKILILDLIFLKYLIFHFHPYVTGIEDNWQSFFHYDINYEDEWESTGGGK